MPADIWPYPAPQDDGAAVHLKSGLCLPDVSLPSTGGEPVNLGTSRGSIVVFIYPWTGRPGFPDPPGWDDIAGAHGSTPQAVGFRDLAPEFAARHVTIFGLSSVTSEWQTEFARRMALNYPLLSDAGLHFSGALKLPHFTAGDTLYLKRLTLICREGEIVRAVYPVHPPDRHAADILASI